MTLTQAIDNITEEHDATAEELAVAVATVLIDQYGKHNFKDFKRVLDLYLESE